MYFDVLFFNMEINKLNWIELNWIELNWIELNWIELWKIRTLIWNFCMLCDKIWTKNWAKFEFSSLLACILNKNLSVKHKIVPFVCTAYTKCPHLESSTPNDPLFYNKFVTYSPFPLKAGIGTDLYVTFIHECPPWTFILHSRIVKYLWRSHSPMHALPLIMTLLWPQTINHINLVSFCRSITIDHLNKLTCMIKFRKYTVLFLVWLSKTEYWTNSEVNWKLLIHVRMVIYACMFWDLWKMNSAVTFSNYPKWNNCKCVQCISFANNF